MRAMLFVFVVCLASITLTWPAVASVTVYTNQAAWQTNVGPYSTINFTELPVNTFIFEQYADLGVHFTDGSDVIYHTDSFLIDGAGVNGAFDETTLEFDTPMTTIAIDFPGTALFRLFSNGQLFYTSMLMGTSGPGHFAG